MTRGVSPIIGASESVGIRTSPAQSHGCRHDGGRRYQPMYSKTPIRSPAGLDQR